ncbi:hypothetical protein ACJJI4_01520 [Microbulbifer sp. TRSA002]|uniref:hypothetical protein n=1 Tax=Microbulbifer sp. TRSA002 TaxID=3243382 RepID=UPI00403931A2
MASIGKYFLGRGRSKFITPVVTSSTIPDPKSQDIVIHIGAPKSGSSAIQKFCMDNREELLKSGYYYPEHPLDVNGVSGGHSRLGVMLIRGDMASAAKLLVEWVEVAKRNQLCLLLSGESFYGRAKELASLVSEYRVKIFAYFRAPISALVSNYNQAIKRHFSTKLLDCFIETKLNESLGGISGDVFKSWIERFGSDNVIVYPYRYSKEEPNSIELNFLNFLGVSRKRINKFSLNIKAVNSSYSLGALELKRQLNYILSDATLSLQHELDWCLQKYSDELQLLPSPLTDVVTLEKLKLLEEKFSISNKYMKESVLAYCPDDFFSETASSNLGEVDTIEKRIPLVELLDAAKAIDHRPYVKEELKELISSHLSNSSVNSYVVYRLADIFGVLYNEPTISKFQYTDKQLQVVKSRSSDGADICRETALALETIGEFEQALLFIKKALALRPSGVVINRIYNRLKVYEN